MTRLVRDWRPPASIMPVKVPAHVVAIGCFDGIHVGHQAIFNRLQRKASDYGLPSAVVLFEPYPKEFFQATPPPRLMCLREKVSYLAALGVDRILCLRFNADFAALSAEDFVKQVLVGTLQARCVVVGDDFRFGAGQEGDVDFLERLGFFEVDTVLPQCLAGERVSSTHIRKLLAAGDFASAAVFLGRFFALSGRVTHGEKRGRRLGFPTLNICLPHKVLPVHGVYVVRVTGLGNPGDGHAGVANVGIRPTVRAKRAHGELVPRSLLEVHVFDFDSDVYGYRVQVEFLQKLREERNFAGIEALQAQIAIDVGRARDFFV